MSGNRSPQGKLTAEDLQRFLSQEPEAAGIARYLRAAAVLSAFDPLELYPAAGTEPAAPKGEAVKRLLPFCEPVTQGEGRGLWSLSLPQRRESLRELGGRAPMKAALGANPERPETPTQKMFERLLEPGPPELGELSREELAAVLEVLEWVEGILDGLPERAAVSKELARSDLLAPMRRLAGRNFFGRESELEHLRQYVFGPKQGEPLFVFGTGGVGKSTLLARFVLKHAAPAGMAIAYVDIDRPVIRPERPLTILLEVAAQLRSQLHAPGADSFIKELTYAMSRYDEGRHLESVGPDDSWVLDLFAKNVKRWLQGRGALLIVDTMEEAQFLGSDVMWPLVEFLLSLNRSLKEFRVILSGRALPEEFVSQAFNIHDPVAGPEGEQELLWRLPAPVRPVNLGVLDEEPALELLRSALEEGEVYGVDEKDLGDISTLVGRNPMCLKLAARLIKEEGVEKLRSERAELFAKLKAEKIQALLYGRVLRHLHDDDVRKVAYPGLIVRRITPEIIREVLAEPCDLELKPGRDEEDIFTDLAKEAALVYVDPEDGSLRHRADVRRSMLEDLTDHVQPSVVKEIDEAAVEYYHKETGGVARAEELYHKMRLGASEKELKLRWDPEAARHLQGALDEVSPQQRLWLAEQLNVTLDEESRQAASQEAWESQAVRSAERYLRSRLPEQALKVLQERKTRSPRSPVYTLEAEAYRFIGKYDESLEVARAGVEAAGRAGAIDMALELLLKMAVIEEARGNLQEAEALLGEAEAVSSHSSNSMLKLRAKVTRLRLQRQLRPQDRGERQSLRKEVTQILEDDVLRMLRDQPVLLREVAAEVGKQDARVTAAALETLGVEVATDAQVKAFGKAVEHFTKSVPKSKGTVKGMGDLKKAGYDPDVVRAWVTNKLTRHETQRISQTLANEDAGSDVLGAFRDYFRAGVSGSLKGKI